MLKINQTLTNRSLIDFIFTDFSSSVNETLENAFKITGSLGRIANRPLVPYDTFVISSKKITNVSELNIQFIDKLIKDSHTYMINSDGKTVTDGPLCGRNHYVINKEFIPARIASASDLCVPGKFKLPSDTNDCKNVIMTNVMGSSGIDSIIYLCVMDNNNLILDNRVGTEFNARTGVNDIPLLSVDNTFDFSLNWKSGGYTHPSITYKVDDLLSKVKIDFTKFTNFAPKMEIVLKFRSSVPDRISPDINGPIKQLNQIPNVGTWNQYYIEGGEPNPNTAWTNEFCRYSGDASRSRYETGVDITAYPLFGTMTNSSFKNIMDQNVNYPSPKTYTSRGSSAALFNPRTKEFGFEDYNDYDYNDFRGLQSNPQLIIEEVVLNDEYGAVGDRSFAMGTDVLAKGNNSFSAGTGTVSRNDNQTTVGQYNNIDDNNDNVFEVGIGQSNSDRKTGLSVSKSGNVLAPNSDIDENSHPKTLITKDELELKISLREIKINKSAPNGYASLDSNGKVPQSELPDITISDTFIVNSQVEMLALTAQIGDIAIRTDINKTFILKTTGATTLSNWQELLKPLDLVTSVNGKVGDVVLNIPTSAGSLGVVQTSNGSGGLLDSGLMIYQNSSSIREGIGASSAYISHNLNNNSIALLGSESILIVDDRGIELNSMNVPTAITTNNADLILSATGGDLSLSSDQAITISKDAVGDMEVPSYRQVAIIGIDEGKGIGYALQSDDRGVNKANIGLNAVDLSVSTLPNKGAVGNHSLCTGRNNLAVGDYSVANGVETTASGEGACSNGLFTSADGNGSNTFGIGTKAIKAYDFACGNETIADAGSAFAAGKDTKVYAPYSHAIGVGGTITSEAPIGAHCEGRYPLDVVADQISVIGIGTHTGSVTKKNGRVTWMDGTGTLPECTSEKITTRGVKAEVIKDYIDDRDIQLSTVYRSGFNIVDEGSTYKILTGMIISKTASGGSLARYTIPETIVTKDDISSTILIYANSNGVFTSFDVDVVKRSSNLILYVVSRQVDDQQFSIVDWRELNVESRHKSNMQRLFTRSITKREGSGVLTVSTNKSFTITPATIYNVDIEENLPEYSSTINSFKYVYNQTVIQNAIVLDHTKYNNNGALLSVNSTKFGNHWIYRECNSTGRIYVVYGSKEFNTVALASEESAPAIRPTILGAFTTYEEMYRVTLQGDGTIAQVTDLMPNRTGGSSTTNGGLINKKILNLGFGTDANIYSNIIIPPVCGQGDWSLLKMGHPVPNGYRIINAEAMLARFVTNSTASVVSLEVRSVPSDGTRTSVITGTSGTSVATFSITDIPNTTGASRYYKSKSTQMNVTIPNDSFIFVKIDNQTLTEGEGIIVNLILEEL